ncbi:hypothetical protein RJ55_02754 [Drechmeria coniospora]|nr:hypothetical protein RJ55_02754 [Drechmeria coniospora]
MSRSNAHSLRADRYLYSCKYKYRKYVHLHVGWGHGSICQPPPRAGVHGRNRFTARYPPPPEMASTCTLHVQYGAALVHGLTLGLHVRTCFHAAQHAYENVIVDSLYTHLQCAGTVGVQPRKRVIASINTECFYYRCLAGVHSPPPPPSPTSTTRIALPQPSTCDHMGERRVMAEKAHVQGTFIICTCATVRGNGQPGASGETEGRAHRSPTSHTWRPVAGGGPPDLAAIVILHSNGPPCLA